MYIFTEQKRMFGKIIRQSITSTNMVHKIMSALMTNEVGIHFVWCMDFMKNNRPKFSNTEIAAQIIGIIKFEYPTQKF